VCCETAGGLCVFVCCVAAAGFCVIVFCVFYDRGFVVFVLVVFVVCLLVRLFLFENVCVL
jgi:hypothetical protein